MIAKITTPNPRGYSLEMGYGYVLPLRPLSKPSWLFPETPISEFFSSSQSYIHLKSHICVKFAF